MTRLIVVVFLSAAVYNTQAQFGYMGEYYVKNRGFTPYNYLDPNAAIEYKTYVTPAPDYLITGEYLFHRKVGPMGLVINTKQQDKNGGGGMVNSGQNFVFENVCNMGDFSIGPFQERFSGRFDENCCIEPGNYTLKDWSIEFHLRPKINQMIYGDYTMHLCWIEKGDKDNCIIKNTIGLIFENANKKEAADRSEMMKLSSKKGKTKKKGGKS